MKGRSETHDAKPNGINEKNDTTRKSKQDKKQEGDAVKGKGETQDAKPNGTNEEIDTTRQSKQDKKQEVPMFKVTGKVLVKETGAGIPDLLVVLFDVDPQAASQSTAYMDPSCLPGAGLKRIGSVLTDEHGGFELSFDASSIAAREPESRPDVILRVFAPEDSQGLDKPESLPPKQRLLLSSDIKRQNAGRTEAYILRISQARLDRFGIPYLRAVRTGIPDKDSLLSALDASFAFEDAVQVKLNQRLAKRLEKARDASRRAKAAFASFYPSSVPKELRSDPTYLAPGDDLITSQKEIVRRDIDRLHSSGRKHTVRMSLTPHELDKIGFTMMSDGTRTVSLKRIFDYIEYKNKGASFIWAKSPLPPCKEEKQATAIIADVKSTTQSLGEPATEPESATPDADHESEAVAIDENGATELTTEKLVRDMVARHMEHVTPAEAHLKYGIPERAQQEDIVTAINALEIKGGPADATAFHDFHNLQIAFEHIWKEEIDGYLWDMGAEIYDWWIDLKQSRGVDDEPDEVVETEEELKRLLGTIATSLEQMDNADVPPPDVIAFLPKMTHRQWQNLTYQQQRRITLLSATWNELVYAFSPEDLERYYGRLVDELRSEAQDIIDAAEERARSEAAANLNLTRFQRLLKELAERINEPHRFDIFAPGSINYGILVTYRQEWQPISYQVGELVSTIPLAPKEIRRYTKKRVVKKSRSQKEVEDSLRVVRRDSADTKRADAEIVDRAVRKTNFRASAEGSGKIGIVELSGSTGLEVQAENLSSQTKKDFREAVLKAAEEYKHERHLEIETAATEELEETASGEISNPNDELTVTYLLYELQRRYEVREKIHRLTPVILVANQVPAPHEIDEDWLIAHDWILKRVILDDSFLPALNSLSKSLVGADFSIEVLRVNVERQARVVDNLQQQIAVKTQLTSQAFEELQLAMEGQASALERDITEGVQEEIMEWIYGEEPGEDVDVAKLRQENAKAAFEQFEREVKDLQSRLSGEVTALNAATEKYTEALEEHLNRMTEISRLRIHVKDNIHYYMQAIWEHEPPDQRFFRLYNHQAIWIPVPEDMVIHFGDGEIVDLEFPWAPIHELMRFETLVEIADLDNLLGFKGNYMIFPLKKNNFVTWYMMQPYLDGVVLRDADEFANYTTEELIENFRCRYSKNPDAFTDEDLQEWRELILQRLIAPRREKDIVIVPTDSLYIEALPGKHPLLEDFKLAHRALDVKKVQAEVRHDELENVRIAARLLSGEREDPDIEKRIIIEGDKHNIIVPPDA